MFDWERTHELQRQWLKTLGLAKVVGYVSSALDQLAHAAGYAHRSSLEDALHADGDGIDVIRGPENDPHVLAEVSGAFQTARHAVALYDETLAGLLPAVHDKLLPEAQDFVCSLELPWPWLAIELVEHFALVCTSSPFGLQLVREYCTDPPKDLVRIPIQLHVELAPGLDVAQSVARLEHAYTEALAALHRQQFPKGRIPPTSEYAALKRFAGWFFRSHVLHESTRSIARSTFPDAFRPEDRSKDVRDGVERAQSLLELSAYRYRPGGDGTFKSSPRGEYIRIAPPL